MSTTSSVYRATQLQCNRLRPTTLSPAGIYQFDIKWAAGWGNGAVGDPARDALQPASLRKGCWPFPVFREGDRGAKRRNPSRRNRGRRRERESRAELGGLPFAERPKHGEKQKSRKAGSDQSAACQHLIPFLYLFASPPLLLETSSGANLHSSRGPSGAQHHTKHSRHRLPFPPTTTPTLHRSLSSLMSIIPCQYQPSPRKMLLPSALPSDLRQPQTQLHVAPNDDFFPSGNGLLGTCRALQTLLNGSPASTPRRATPPRLQSPLQLRSPPPTRSRKRVSQKDVNLKQDSPSPIASPSRPPRGANKRCRDTFEIESETDTDNHKPTHSVVTESRLRYSTPKRRRHIPNDLPLGLTQSDFYSLFSPPITQSPPSPAHRTLGDLDGKEGPERDTPSYNPDAALPSIEISDDFKNTPLDEPSPIDSSPSWTAEDDTSLVDLVLSKIQLSRQDLNDCARKLGRDGESIGHRWRALLDQGDVGLRRTVKRRPDES
ncbi:uncharacterized protein BO80DRAFT_454263 [Aspergillus ibericus CBS 121593]|uniref:Myb-like domain-containing protein n=1 Tax=Aspergillus ibericus CBS 121593 TaxID=1448316 RepID=A0A395H3U9_9EURO|nr:hypothetical protein BO80DRAFT_454263 [Aspergillus ibericus CBS 121593]RAL02119.1 hypothetical protein BO80DRAFT_454263 [Aspergillus ibericus CBS 121593]